MNNNTQQYIENAAETFFRKYKLTVPVTSKALIQIITRLGGQVDETKLDPVLDPTIGKTDDLRFTIRIETNLSETNKTYALAHELGHLILHMGLLIDKDLWMNQPIGEFRSFPRYEQEQQANAFAQALLMPKKNIEQAIKQLTKNNCIDPKDLAEKFGVNKGCIIQRARMLAFIH